MYADKAIINLQKENVTMIGNVSVYNGPFLSKGEKTVYFY